MKKDCLKCYIIHFSFGIYLQGLVVFNMWVCTRHIFPWGPCNVKIFMGYLFCVLDLFPTLQKYKHAIQNKTEWVCKIDKKATLSFFLLRRNRRSSLCCLDTKLTAAYSNNAEKTNSRQTAIQISIALTYDTYRNKKTVSRKMMWKDVIKILRGKTSTIY